MEVPFEADVKYDKDFDTMAEELNAIVVEFVSGTKPKYDLQTLILSYLETNLPTVVDGITEVEPPERDEDG